MQRYQHFQDDENKIAAYNLLSQPQNFVEKFDRYATSVASIIAYGRRISSLDDPITQDTLRIMRLAAMLSVPAKTFPMLMETFPGEYTRNLLPPTGCC